MKFAKGILIGGLLTTGIIMMYNQNEWNINKKKMMKKGKQFVKKMGVM